MKKCPYCGRENEAAAVACVECGKEFDTLPPAKIEPDLLDPALSPMVVATFSSLVEANFLVDRLETAGIQADIPEEYSPQIFSAVIALERLTVRVAAKDYEAAKLIAAEGGDVALTSDELGGSVSASKPGSEGISSEPAHEQTGDQQGGKLCVSCGAAIPHSARQCPACGWTQPE